MLVTLDKIPYQIIVDEKQAAYGVAKANLVVAQDEFRGLIGKARSVRFNGNTRSRTLTTRWCCCGRTSPSSPKRTPTTNNAINLQKTPGVRSQQDVDQYKAAYLVALEQVYQTLGWLGAADEARKRRPDRRAKEPRSNVFHGPRRPWPTCTRPSRVAGNLAQILRLHAPAK